MATTAFSAPVRETQEPAICIDEARWGAAMMRWHQACYRAKLEWTAYEALPEGHPDAQVLSELTEQSGTEESAAEDALLFMPAPDLAALRWKLDRIITFHEGDQGEKFMDSYDFRWVQQTMADYRRLLPAG